MLLASSTFVDVDGVLDGVDGVDGPDSSVVFLFGLVTDMKYR